MTSIPPHRPTATDSGSEWDTRYRDSERLWTAEVNPALRTETAGLTPGTALDVGSGEGADARWLAEHGWTVSAVDISRVALQRAREIDPAASISWIHADVTCDDVPGSDFALVSVHYLPLATAHRGAARNLVDAVGAGGSLLVVAHAPDGVRAHGFDPDDYLQPGDFAALLDSRWTIVTHETRERGRPAGGGHHVNDVVLRARRD